ncbi:uncharacterized protein LOC114366220 isoform X1 [Ostrinia furnacalis]|uniref:uncharacterized protein LOC114366220 isoform X1 n=1 Tax=Ostrinia furnacalis TaxID=93504 RepID=UPI00103C3C4B|nr:uncharacterized protein LOC114366220 isoform X1 [Ostrinia furnacalis]
MNRIMRSQVDMRLVVVYFFATTLISGCHGDQKDEADAYMSRFVADLWLEGADVVKIIWRDCSKKLVDVKDVIDHKEYFPKFLRCMKRKTLRALDRSLSPDVVPIADGVNLVRFELVDRSGNIVPENETSSWTEKELEEGEWRTLALQRMAKVLRTHVIKFDFEDGKTLDKVEYRGRRRHQMMTMMMFGIVSIGMVLVPMGFQFLAVLGGKALLLAKMALILASIQGLKKVEPNYDGYHERGKIASSPVNYGFYHSYPYDPYYEKRSRDDWPQPGLMPATPPPSMSVQNPWPNSNSPVVKIDRSIEHGKDFKHTDVVTWKPELPKAVKQEAEARIYPVYPGPDGTPPIFTSIDAPTPLTDITTRPGDVQADYALELPYNGLRFQSPTTVVSA